MGSSKTVEELRDMAQRVLRRSQMVRSGGNEDAADAYLECAKMLTRRADVVESWETRGTDRGDD